LRFRLWLVEKPPLPCRTGGTRQSVAHHSIVPAETPVECLAEVNNLQNRFSCCALRAPPCVTGLLLANERITVANLDMRVLSRFVAAATDISHFPAPSVPEVAFLGRSNVGKSSVINSLVGTKLARTSSTPGRTRSINFFEIRWPGKPRPELIFADLPGYGYAKIAREVSQEWPRFIEPYLNERTTLALCVALIDVNVPPQQSDRQLLDFLAASGRPVLLIGTKSDRLSNHQLNNVLRTLGRDYPTARLLPYSSKTGAGRDELWKQIREVCQAVANGASLPAAQH